MEMLKFSDMELLSCIILTIFAKAYDGSYGTEEEDRALVHRTR